MRIIDRNHDKRPIALKTAMDHLRVGEVDSDQREIIELKLDAAIDLAERSTNRIIAAAVAEYPIAPLAKCYELLSATRVDRVEYEALDGTRKELPAEMYRTTLSDFGLMIQFFEWPKDITAEKLIERCWVIADVGFDENTVPRGIVAAVLLTLGTLYDNESDEIVGRSVSRLTTSAERLLTRYRITP